ncbi:SDR family oxidoreductase [Ensifer sp. Root127]|uniref:SDR family oxidoreductase n=1 Tax=Ensifer sp. Root127 TaxID=1736440 RepID=UPI000AF3CFFF|nr:SDR family oxidoreductase [Ensifer sp. Root127]
MKQVNGGRKALVLGGGKGLGYGVAEAFAKDGIEVGLVGRDSSALHSAEMRIRTNRGIAHTFQYDLSREADVEELLKDVDARLGQVDIILLNGGGPPPFLASVFEPTIWHDQFRSMVSNQIKIATHFLPGMRSRLFGRILVVSSTSVREPIGGLTASNALRAALAGWAKTLASEVAAEGVTVNLLLPGRFTTQRTIELDALDAKDRGVERSLIEAESQAEIPVKRYGTVAEFGAAAAFLAGEGASYITGIALPIDGGLSRAIL